MVFRYRSQGEDAFSELDKAEAKTREAREKVVEVIRHLAYAMKYTMGDRKQMIANIRYFAEAILNDLSKLEEAIGDTKWA